MSSFTSVGLQSSSENPVDFISLYVDLYLKFQRHASNSSSDDPVACCFLVDVVVLIFVYDILRQLLYNSNQAFTSENRIVKLLVFSS